MEQETVTPQPISDQTIPPQQQLPTTNKKRLFLSIGIAVIFILILVIGSATYYFNNHKTNNSLQQPKIINTNQAWKTYTNSYYNFKLDIPSDWNIEEKVIKDKKYVNGEYQTFKLSSPNEDLTIDNMSIFDKNNHIKEQLPNTKVQLGIYTLDRYPYINDDNQRIDYVQLLNIKRQDSVTFAFNFKGDIEKNNELLLKILKTFAYTKQKPSLDDKISYTIPTGWTKEDTDTSLSLSFISSDLHEEGLPTIVSGARISINKIKKDISKTIAQLITPEDSFGKWWNISTRSAILKNNEYTNIFYCAGEFGGCMDAYAIENSSNIWIITMVCNKNCDTKSGIDSTIYAKDRDLFLSSIKLR